MDEAKFGNILRRELRQVTPRPELLYAILGKLPYGGVTATPKPRFVYTEIMSTFGSWKFVVPSTLVLASLLLIFSLTLGEPLDPATEVFAMESDISEMEEDMSMADLMFEEESMLLELDIALSEL
jgi:hypothetical protein